MTIGFIGAGNMAGALIKNIRKHDKDMEIFIRCSSDESTEKKSKALGVFPASSLGELVEKSNIIFLGVKPNKAEEVLSECRDFFTKDKTLVSMAAGIKIKILKDWTGWQSKVIRIMPNLPAQIGKGLTSISGGNGADDKEVYKLLSYSGTVVDVSEDEIHGVIGVSGSSPAYTYMYIKGLMMAAEHEGISKEDARKMAAKAVEGAAALVLDSGEDIDTMIDRVCSKGGTTIEAVNKLRELSFEEIVARGAQEAIYKSKKMSE